MDDKPHNPTVTPYPIPGAGGLPHPPPPMPLPRPPVVHVVAKPGGFWRAIMFVIGLAAFAGVFFVGIGFGALSMMFAPTADSTIIAQTYRAGTSGRIAILPVMDVIDASSAEFARMATDHILNDGGYRAVVLRVDSPGGGVTASDQIWSEVERLKAAGLPVVASYGSVAASGGYYVSCGADYIMAEETSITGSIGVIAQVFTFEDLADKIGVEPVTLVASGSPQKDVANDLFRSWNDDDRAKVMTMLDASYDVFVKRVRDGRGDAIESEGRLAELANGSIFTSAEALDSGLIDGVGYLDDAIARAETLGSITRGGADVVILKQPPSFFPSGLFASTRRPEPALNAETIRRFVNDLGTPRVMYLMH